MAEKETKVKQKKGRVKGPKLTVGDFPYVSLMPANRLNAIEVEEAKAKWIKTVGAGVVIAIVIAVASVGFKVVHQLSYDAAKTDAAAVETSILEYGDVDDALSIKNDTEANILVGTKSSIDWQLLQNRISQNLPEGSSISTFNVQTGGGKDDTSTAAVFVNVSSLQPIAYAQILNSFGQVEGLIADSLLIGDLTSSGSADTGLVYSYPVAFTVDKTILAKRWAYLTEDGGSAPADAPAAIQEEQLPVPVPSTNENEETE